jgi:hypothetical protein
MLSGMVYIQNHIFSELHNSSNPFTVGNILTGNQHIGNIAFNGHFIKVVSEKTQQRVEVVNMGVVNNQKKEKSNKY